VNAAGIIALAGAYGVSLTADTKRIIAKPATNLTPELREAIRSHSTELLEVLTRDHRCARLDPDTGALRNAVDRRRQISGVPRNTRQDDRRTAPSNSSTRQHY
jgi:hypothetical protein